MNKYKIIFRCMFCGREQIVNSGSPSKYCECLEGKTMSEENNITDFRIKSIINKVDSLESELYFLTKELIPEMQAKIERLMNKIKCMNCKKCDINKDKE